jgi:hypothetical protein
MNSDRSVGETLYANALTATARNEALVQAIRAMVKERNEQLAGNLTAASAPAVRMAYEGLYKSDIALIEAGNALAAASEELRRSFEPLPREIKTALERAQQAKMTLQPGRVGEAVAAAAGDIISTAEPVSQLVEQTVGSALMFSHLILVDVHNANARFLGRKEWIHAKEVEAFRTLLEGAGHDVLHVAVITGAGALGVAVGHALLPLGLAVAGIQVVYKMNRSQVKEAHKREVAADARFENRYALQQANENLAGDTRQVAKLLADAKGSGESIIACLKAGVAKLELEELGVSVTLEDATDLEKMQALHKAIKSGTYKPSSNPPKKL